MSLPFRVSPDVLIPRSETETLVERMLEDAKTETVHTILDIGTGSGCIAVSLAANLPDVQVTGMDTSQTVLSIASYNARLNGVQDRVRFVEGDIRTDLDLESRFDALVSNPPYVALDEWNSLLPEIQKYEPRMALCDESDGLTFYRVIAEKSGSLLENKGRLYLEVGDRQSGPVCNILNDAGFSRVEVFPDLNHIDRVVRAIL